MLLGKFLLRDVGEGLLDSRQSAFHRIQSLKQCSVGHTGGCAKRRDNDPEWCPGSNTLQPLPA
ncbi:hypothetical protein GCM10009655_13520 [Rhodoglobus aureus]|uniref:Uncharacterized protein n=1 Tax=Rhodoglobus aureus TaxID=191497 RepID=A0ABN1VKZ7_9MICO